MEDLYEHVVVVLNVQNAILVICWVLALTAMGRMLCLWAPARWEEFALYCSCGRPPTVSRWSSRELKSYQVLNVAYHRGSGVCGEIVPIPVGKAAPKRSKFIQSFLHDCWP